MKAASIISIYNLVLFGYVVGALFVLWRTRSPRRRGIFLFLTVMMAAVGVIGAFFTPIDVFGQIQLITWMTFVRRPRRAASRRRFSASWIRARM